MKIPTFTPAAFCLIIFLISSSYGPLFSQNYQLVETGLVATDSANSIGGSWIDVNNDALLDLFVVNDGGDRNRLYLNNGDSTFSVASGPLLNDSTNSWGATWGDIDNDGDLDVFLANWGSDSTSEFNSLYLGNGSGSFTPASGSGLDDLLSKSAGCSWADYDLDGYLDLFVANGALAESEKNALYHNEGDGTFTRMDISPFNVDSFKSAFGAWGDYDSDGDPDLYIVNEGNAQPNNLYNNQGDGTFLKVTTGEIVTDMGSGRGASWGDFDNDRDLDLFVTRWVGQDNLLYRNEGDGTFVRITSGDAVSDGGRSEGSAWVDFDNDRDLDLFVGNWGDEPNFLYENDGNGGLNRIFTDSIATELESSVGIAFGDFTNNGFLDLFVANTQKPLGAQNSVYLNKGGAGNWLTVNLVGTVSNQSAIGAKVLLKAGGHWQMRELSGQSGFGGQNSLQAHFGLANSNNVPVLIVNFPSGITMEFEDISPNQVLTIVEEEPSVGLQNLVPKSPIAIYPNPASGSFQLELPLAEGPGALSIMDFNGQLVAELGMFSPGGGFFHLPTDLAAGCYLIQLTGEGWSRTTPLFFQP